MRVKMQAIVWSKIFQDSAIALVNLPPSFSPNLVVMFLTVIVLFRWSEFFKMARRHNHTFQKNTWKGGGSD